MDLMHKSSIAVAVAATVAADDDYDDGGDDAATAAKGISGKEKSVWRVRFSICSSAY